MFASDKSHRQVPASLLNTKSLFLTFDDGPDPASTAEVMDLLAAKRAAATFFLVAERAAAQKALIERMQAMGFAIGNHSLDHHYLPFFKSTATLKAWVSASEKTLQSLIQQPSIGFRSPAGVQTPRLHAVLKELQMPLVHWNKRFYDAVLPWYEAQALRSLAKTRSGSIILLHDSQQGLRKKFFLKTLARYIDHAHELGFTFLPLRRDYFSQE